MNQTRYMTRERFRNAIMVLALITLAIGSVSAEGANPELLFEELSQQVVWIETKDELGRSSGQGSGLVLGPSLCRANVLGFDKRYHSANSNGIDILSNFHVVAFAREIVVRTKSEDAALAAVVFCDAERDLAILRTVRTFKVKPVNFATSYKIGQRVYALGSPKGLGWTFSDGMISGVRQENGSKLIQTTAPISPGSSGGGLFNDQAKLIGMTTLQISEGQNLNFALELVSASSELNDLRIGNCIRPLGIDPDEWVVGAIKIASYGIGDLRSSHPKWREWKECSAAVRIIETNYPKKSITATGEKTPAYVQWEAKKWKALAHRFSLFPSDIDGLIGALELAKDSKEREELVQKSSVAAKSQMKVQRYLLLKLSAKLDAHDRFYEFFDQIVDSLANKPSPPDGDPWALTFEIEETTRDFTYCLNRLKQSGAKTGIENANKLEESLRKKGWL